MVNSCPSGYFHIFVVHFKDNPEKSWYSWKFLHPNELFFQMVKIYVMCLMQYMMWSKLDHVCMHLWEGQICDFICCGISFPVQDSCKVKWKYQRWLLDDCGNIFAVFSSNKHMDNNIICLVSCFGGYTFYFGSNAVGKLIKEKCINVVVLMDKYFF
jgi:hypothetical protein